MLLFALLACAGPKPSVDTGSPVVCPPSTWYADADGDGFGDPEAAVEACEPPGAEVADGTDCDDADAAAFPGAPEECTSVKDLNCDGAAGDPDEDGDGVVACLDCDDADATAWPGATEFCDGADDDCDGSIDEEPSDGLAWYADGDADGYGDRDVELRACEQPAGYVATIGDCDDATAAVSPDATEMCNGLDDDCDGSTDEDEAADALPWYDDADIDGYGDPAGLSYACEQPDGTVADATDCDDANVEVHPGVDELCNGHDDNCDGSMDDATSVNRPTWYADTDLDGFGDPTNTTLDCAEPAGYTADHSDCDDADPTEYPAAAERCDGDDDDCDGDVDESTSVDAATWYADADGDGHGDWAVPLSSCTQPVGFVASLDDCNDTNAAISPDGSEVCNSADDDCDGTIDEPDAADALDWYADADGDTYGDPAVTTHTCAPPPAYVTDDTDCDDASAVVSPASTELCNSVDDDCDGTVDDNDAVDATTWYLDTDYDGYGESTVTMTACSVPSGYAAVGDDCDDTDAAYNPGAAETDCNSPYDYNCDGRIGDADSDGDGYYACEECDDSDPMVSPVGVEVCNSIDDNCDGTIDEGVTPTWYADADGDTYGDATVTSDACTAPSGFVTDDMDCDDADSAVNPAASESCDTEVDDDCDGSTNAVDATGCVKFYYDFDGDGYGNTAHQCLCEADGVVSADNNDDCDDGEATAYPGGTEVWGNLVDEDCDDEPDELALVDADIRLLGSTANGDLGLSIAFAGDTNGDGYDDVIVGSPGAGLSSTGEAHVVLGPLTADTTVDATSPTITGELRSGYAGTSVDGGKDLNGDGYDDVLIGAYNAGAGNEGRAYVLFGPLTLAEPLNAADGAYTGVRPSDRAGQSVALVDDMDGDTLPDILVGAPYNDDGGATAGAAYVVSGPGASAASLSAATASLIGENSNDYAGLKVASAGDVDGDGVGDIVIGAYANDSGGSNAGAAYVLLGPVSGTVDLSLSDGKLTGERSSDNAGYAVASAGDTDADGLDDLLIGAINHGNGAAYVVLGGFTGVQSLADSEATVGSGTASSNLAIGVAGVGDVDSDGYLDFLLGDFDNDALASNGGSAHLVFGPLSGDYTIDDEASDFLGGTRSGYAGRCVAAVGDVDADGVPDFAIGEENGSGTASASGVAYIWLGH